MLGLVNKIPQCKYTHKQTCRHKRNRLHWSRSISMILFAQSSIELWPSSLSSSVEPYDSNSVLAVAREVSPLCSLTTGSSPSLAASVSSELKLGLRPKSAISWIRGLTVLGLTMAAWSFSQTLRKRRVGPAWKFLGGDIMIITSSEEIIQWKEQDIF